MADVSQRMVERVSNYSSFDPQDEDNAAYKDPNTIINVVLPGASIEYIIKPWLNIE